MAGMTIPFIHRQTLITDQASLIYYSEPFDLTPYANITVEFTLYGLLGTGVTVGAELLTANDLTRPTSDWEIDTTIGAKAAAGDYRETVTVQARYGRIAVTLASTGSDGIATLQVMGAAKTA